MGESLYERGWRVQLYKRRDLRVSLINRQNLLSINLLLLILLVELENTSGVCGLQRIINVDTLT